MSSPKGDEVGELVVVEIKKFVWRRLINAEGLLLLLLVELQNISQTIETFGRRQRLMLPTPPLALLSPTALSLHAQLNELCRHFPSRSYTSHFRSEHCISMTQCLYVRPESTPRNEPTGRV